MRIKNSNATEIEQNLANSIPINSNLDYLFAANGVIMLTGTIDDKKISTPIEQIIIANQINVFNNLTLVINSPGGDVASAFALIDIMNASKIPIHTNGFGKIMSCGLLIFMSGTNGHRNLFPNTMILSHQFSAGFSSQKEHELVSFFGEANKISKKIKNHYIKCTGLDSNTIENELLKTTDTYLTPKEAIKYGLADKVITTMRK